MNLDYNSVLPLLSLWFLFAS